MMISITIISSSMCINMYICIYIYIYMCRSHGESLQRRQHPGREHLQGRERLAKRLTMIMIMMNSNNNDDNNNTNNNNNNSNNNENISKDANGLQTACRLRIVQPRRQT